MAPASIRTGRSIAAKHRPQYWDQEPAGAPALADARSVRPRGLKRYVAQHGLCTSLTHRPFRPEETAELVTQAGGRGIAVVVDHLEPDQVRGLVERIARDHQRLDLLVNDIWGGELLFEWNKPVWEHALDRGLRLLRLAIDTHLITNHVALPLLLARPGGLVIEMTDGTAAYNATHYRVSLPALQGCKTPYGLVFTRQCDPRRSGRAPRRWWPAAYGCR